MSKYGNLDFDERWYDEPVERYLDYKQTESEVTDKRYRDIKNIVADSPDHKSWESWDEHCDWQKGMNVADARSFKHQLEDADLAT
jgi:hypothetical protein